MTEPLTSKVAFVHLNDESTAAVLKMQLPDGGQVLKNLDLAEAARLISQLSDAVAVMSGAKPAPSPVNEKYFQK